MGSYFSSVFIIFFSWVISNIIILVLLISIGLQRGYLFGKYDGFVYTEYKTDILIRKDNYKIEFSEIGRDDIEGIMKIAKKKNALL